MKFGNLHFLWMLWLIPTLIVFYIWAFKRKQQLINRFVGEELKDRLLQGVSFTRQKFKYAIIILSVLFAVISLIRPKWGFKWEEVKRRGVDIIVALDVSTSMLAEDVKPNRLQRAKREIIDLLNILEGDRVGLVAFAGTSFLQSPLTLDYGAVQIFLDMLSTDLIPIPGTAIGNAIKKSVASFDQEDKKSRVLILITDGEDHQGKPIEQAKEAAKQQVKIYTIGIGKEGGAPIPDHVRGGFKKDRKGEMILTHLDEDSLQKIALETGGSYVRSVTGDFDLEKIYNDIRANVDDKELKSGRRKRFEERFQWPLIVALLLLVFEALYSEKRRRNILSVLRKGKGLFGIFILLLSLNSQAQLLTGFSSKGEKLYKDGKYAEALKQFTDDQINAPNDQNLKYNLGSTYYKMKQYDKAEKLFHSTALYGDKELAQKSYYNLGNSAYHQGKLQEAVEFYKKAIELDPNDKDAKKNLEFVREEIKRRIEKNKKQKKENKQCKNPKNKEDKGKEDKKKKSKQDKKDQDKKEQEEQKAQPKDGSKEDKKEEKQAQQMKESDDKDKKKMSKEEAMRLLESLDDDQKKKNKKQMQGNPRYRVEKDW